MVDRTFGVLEQLSARLRPVVRAEQEAIGPRGEDPDDQQQRRHADQARRRRSAAPARSWPARPLAARSESGAGVVYGSWGSVGAARPATRPRGHSLVSSHRTPQSLVSSVAPSSSMRCAADASPDLGDARERLRGRRSSCTYDVRQTERGTSRPGPLGPLVGLRHPGCDGHAAGRSSASRKPPPGRGSDWSGGQWIACSRATSSSGSWSSAINSAHIQAALKQALESDGAAKLIDSLFDSGLIDRFLAWSTARSTGSSTGCWPARASGI